MEKLDTSNKKLKQFGITMGVAFLVINLLILFGRKHSIFATGVASVVFFLFGFVYPKALKWVYIFWMRLAFVLAWVNTRIILLSMFYLIFTPVGLIMKLFNQDHLEKRFPGDKQSYWHKKEPKPFNKPDYEKQF